MSFRSTTHDGVMHAAALFLAALVEDQGLSILGNEAMRAQAVKGAIALSEEVDRQMRESS
jgi:hypothetical protein